MEIGKVGVVGCGLMGSGIAQVSAMAGYQTVVREVAQPLLGKGLAAIDKSLSKFVEKETLTAEQKTATLGCLKPTLRLEDFSDCDMVIEAIVENRDRKKELFTELERIVKPGAIFASNTSSLSITEMMTVTRRGPQFIGLHFFNPVPLMQLVEVVKTVVTDSESCRRGSNLLAGWGRRPYSPRTGQGLL
jgi:3-hydroxybutyryl-CoA dehydrogenase